MSDEMRVRARQRLCARRRSETEGHCGCSSCCCCDGAQPTRSQERAAGRPGRQDARPMPLVALLIGLLALVPLAAAETSATTEATIRDAPQNATEPQADLGAVTSPASVSKLKPVNFTLVDELFDSVLSEPEVLRRWRLMDGQFQEGIRSILKLVFPQIVAISQDAKVSGDCSGGILKWILSLRNLRSWAIKMLDATGKPTAGIFEGSLTMFGNHRQCLAIRAPDEDEIEITDQFEEYFRGQFCVLHMRPWLPAKRPFYHLNSTIEPLPRRTHKYYERTLYDELAEIAIAFNFIDIRMDLCVPSTCSMADIQRVADLLSRQLEMRAKVMRCDIESREPGATLVQHLDKTTVYWLIGPLGLILINLIATILVALGVFGGPASSRANHRIASSHQETTGEARLSLASALYSLSVQGALEHLLARPKTISVIVHEGTGPATGTRSGAGAGTNPTTNNNNNNNNNYENGATGSPSRADGASVARAARRWAFALDRDELLRRPLPLYGLRNVFVFWFVIVQLTVELKYQYLRESLVLRNMMLAYWPLQIIINTSMIFESLILITAFTYSYCNLAASAKSLLAYMGKKYLRLMPSIVTLVLITIILPHIGITSPVWKNFVEQQSGVCKSNGYLDLVFLQNFIAYDKVCLPHTWLFCVELQLMALSIPLVLFLQKIVSRDERLDQLALQEEKDRALAGKAARKDGTRCGGPLRLTAARLLASRAGLLGGLLVVCGAAANFLLVYSNGLPPSWFHTFPDAEQKSYYFGKYFTKAWAHLTTFVIGLYAGCLTRSVLARSMSAREPDANGRSDGDSGLSICVHQRQRALVLWRLAALACLLTIIFSTFSWSTQELPSALVSGLYDSLARVIWSLALAGLMVQLCLPRGANDSEATYSGLASVFSHPVCLALGKLSFLAYLISPLVHTFVLAVQEQSLFPSLFIIFHVIVGNIVITYLLAFVLSLMIEQPIRLLVRQLCCINTRTRGSATISTANVTTATSATSLANQQ